MVEGTTISICICTFNRCEILEHCLASLRQLIDPRPEHDLEIVIVDNNSQDGTRALIERLIPLFPFKMRYIFEAQQGLSAARNRAIDVTKGDYIAFLDDECIIAPDWLSIAIADINEYRPCVIGGPYYGAFLPGQRPRWFKAEYGNAYFLTRGYHKGFQNEFRASGGNMLIRRDVFETVRFDTALGMNSGKLKLGEEIELQDRFLRAHRKEKIFYEPALVAWHFILPQKMRLAYHVSRIFAAALMSPAKVDNKSFLVALTKALFYISLIPVKCILRDRTKYLYWQNYLYERGIPATIFQAGLVVKYLRDKYTNLGITLTESDGR